MYKRQHPGQEDGHRLQGEAGHLVGGRDQEPGQHHADGGQQGAGDHGPHGPLGSAVGRCMGCLLYTSQNSNNCKLSVDKYSGRFPVFPTASRIFINRKLTIIRILHLTKI